LCFDVNTTKELEINPCSSFGWKKIGNKAITRREFGVKTLWYLGRKMFS